MFTYYWVNNNDPIARGKWLISIVLQGQWKLLLKCSLIMGLIRTDPLTRGKWKSYLSYPRHLWTKFGYQVSSSKYFPGTLIDPKLLDIVHVDLGIDELIWVLVWELWVCWPSLPKGGNCVNACLIARGGIGRRRQSGSLSVFPCNVSYWNRWHFDYNKVVYLSFFHVSRWIWVRDQLPLYSLFHLIFPSFWFPEMKKCVNGCRKIDSP